MPGDPLLARPSAESVLPTRGRRGARLTRAGRATARRAGCLLFESSSRSTSLFEHDLSRKPVATFRDHALALAGLVALLRLVDDVDAALAAHDLVVAVAPAQRLEGIADLHRSDLRRVTVIEDRPIANEKRTGRGIHEDPAGAPSAWCAIYAESRGNATFGAAVTRNPAKGEIRRRFAATSCAGSRIVFHFASLRCRRPGKRG